MQALRKGTRDRQACKSCYQGSELGSVREPSPKRGWALGGAEEQVASALLRDSQALWYIEGHRGRPPSILVGLSMEVNTQGIGVPQGVHELSEAPRGLCTTRHKPLRQRNARARPFLVELVEHLFYPSSTVDVKPSGTRLQGEEGTPTKRSSSQQKEGYTGSVCTDSRWRAFPARTRS